MDQLLKLAEAKNSQTIRNFLENLKLDEVFGDFRREGTKGNPSIVTALRTIFRGCHASDDYSIEMRKKIYMKALEFVQETELTSRISIDIIGLLLMETDKLNSNFLPIVASKLIEAIQEPDLTCTRITDLLPKVIYTLTSRHTVMYDGIELTGQECKAEVIRQLCSVQWEPQNAVMMASLFREVPLSVAELQVIIDKLVKNISDMEIQEVPPLIYQLLLLGSLGLRDQVLRLVIEYFNEQDEKLDRGDDESIRDCMSSAPSHSSLLHVEGTVILHITFAAKQDQELVKTFVKMLKSSQHIPGYVLAPFTIALALSLGKIMSYGEQIVDLLKNIVVRNFREQEKVAESCWLREIHPQEKDRSQAILTAVQNSKSGWEYVSQGFVQLGFALMDSYGPKAYFGKDSDILCETNSSPTQQACILGAKIIEGIFKICANVRPEVVQQLVDRILMKSASPISHYIAVLSNTVQSVPQFYLDSLHQVQKVIESLPFLPLSTSIFILTALTPLIKKSMSLKDSLMLVLRKALFHRNVSARKVAVASFLHILKNFRIMGGMSLSQGSCYSTQFSPSDIVIDVHSRYSSEANETLCLELLSVVKRCLKQQSEVREVFYKELPKVLLMNPHLANSIMGILHNQFEEYYERNEDVNPPIKLLACVKVHNDEPVLVEPLSSLMLSIQKCLVSYTEHSRELMDLDDIAEVTSYSFTSLQKIMNDIVKRMVKAELEDFELDKTAQFSTSNSIGAKNHLMASQLLQIYQVLLEYCFMVARDSTDSCQNMLVFYDNYKKLLDVLREKSHGIDKENKGRKGGKVTKNSQFASQENNVISPKCLSEILEKIFCECGPEELVVTSCLTKHADFIPFVVGLANQHIQNLRQTAERKNMEKICKFCCTVGKAYMSQIFPFSSAASQISQPQTTLNASCLEGLSNLINFVQNLSPKHLVDFLVGVGHERQKPSSQSQSTILVTNIKKFQDVVISILSKPNKEQKLKDLVIPLLNIIGTLSKHVMTEANVNSVYDWLKDLCIQQSITETAVIKCMLGLCLKLARQGKELPSLVYDLSGDLHQVFGDIDEDVELNEVKKFSIMSSKSGVSICLLVLNSMEQILDEIDWLVMFLRSNAVAFVKPNTKQALLPATRSLKESSICSKFGHLITALHELAQAKLPLGPCTDTTLKLLTKFYSSVVAFIKYYVTVYRLKVGALCHRFEKLIKILGTSLTPQVYSLITYILNTGQENPEKLNQSSKSKSSSLMVRKPKVDRKPTLIPSLIFTIEQYERYLLQLSKKSKVDLMQHIKLSTSRDFRINLDMVAPASHNVPPASDEESNEERDENEVE